MNIQIVWIPVQQGMQPAYSTCVPVCTTVHTHSTESCTARHAACLYYVCARLCARLYRKVGRLTDSAHPKLRLCAFVIGLAAASPEGQVWGVVMARGTGVGSGYGCGRGVGSGYGTWDRCGEWLWHVGQV